MQTLTATRNAEGFEPISVLSAELRYHLDGGNGSGVVGHLYDDDGKPTHIIRTDGTYHMSDRFDAFPAMKPSGSMNYSVKAAAVRLLTRYKFDHALAGFSADLQLSRGNRSVPGVHGLLGTEIGLGNYFPSHFLARLVAARYSPDAAATVQLLLALVTLSRFTSLDRIAHVGQRGAVPGQGEPNWVDALGSILTGESIEKWRKGWGWPHNWVSLDILSDIIHKTYGTMTRDLDHAVSVLRTGAFTRVRWEWLYTGERSNVLVATFQDRTIHGATPPMLAAVHTTKAGLIHFPRNGGRRRIRSKSDQATCRLGGGKLMYRAKFSRPSPDEIQLPRYNRVIVWDGKTVTDAELEV